MKCIVVSQINLNQYSNISNALTYKSCDRFLKDSWHLSFILIKSADVKL